MPAWATALLPLLLYQGTVQLHAASDRSKSFIGYSEKATFCEDTLWDCVPRARRNGCIYDPFRLRQHCPTTCTIERCSYHGSIRARHRGHATAEGTLAYSQLMSAQCNLRKDFYRMVQIKAADEQLMLSPMGIGTYLGEADAHTDEAVVNAILFTVSHGWNVIDTASNYRWGRAEASVGTALSVMLAGDSASSFAHEATRQSLLDRLGPALTAEPDAEVVEQLEGAAVTASHQGGDITRDMLFISTKAGFTTPELVNDLIKQRVMGFNDVVSGMHSIHPAYVKASVMQSLSRLHLETVDLFYLHNSAEVHLPSVGRDKYMERLLAAFHACEELRGDGKIQAYGLATWDCFRKPPEDPLYLSLSDLVALAQQAGGADHGFRFVQLPVNVGMPEAWLEPYQQVDGRNMTLIEAARQLHVGIMTSKPLGDGGLASSLAQHLDQAQELSGFTSAPSKLLQYARSVEGVITTLVGHKSQSNAEANIQVSLRAPLDHEQFISAHRTIAESRLRAKHAN